MDILLIWLATIILSGAMSITLVIKFLKEAKRNGYVINHDYKDNNESYMNKLTVLMMFTPIVNIIYSLKASMEYVNDKEKVIDQMITREMLIKDEGKGKVSSFKEILNNAVTKVQCLNLDGGYIIIVLDDNYEKVVSVEGKGALKNVDKDILFPLAQNNWNEIMDFANSVYGSKEAFIEKLKNNNELVKEIQESLKLSKEIVQQHIQDKTNTNELVVDYVEESKKELEGPKLTRKRTDEKKK